MEITNDYQKRCQNVNPGGSQAYIYIYIYMTPTPGPPAPRPWNPPPLDPPPAPRPPGTYDNVIYLYAYIYICIFERSAMQPGFRLKSPPYHHPPPTPLLTHPPSPIPFLSHYQHTPFATPSPIQFLSPPVAKPPSPMHPFSSSGYPRPPPCTLQRCMGVTLTPLPPCNLLALKGASPLPMHPSSSRACR